MVELVSVGFSMGSLLEVMDIEGCTRISRFLVELNCVVFCFIIKVNIRFKFLIFLAGLL